MLYRFRESRSSLSIIPHPFRAAGKPTIGRSRAVRNLELVSSILILYGGQRDHGARYVANEIHETLPSGLISTCCLSSRVRYESRCGCIQTSRGKHMYIRIHTVILLCAYVAATAKLNERIAWRSSFNNDVSISKREWVSVSGRVTCSWRTTIMRIFIPSPSRAAIAAV